MKQVIFFTDIGSDHLTRQIGHEPLSRYAGNDVVNSLEVINGITVSHQFIKKSDDHRVGVVLLHAHNEFPVDPEDMGIRIYLVSEFTYKRLQRFYHRFQVAVFIQVFINAKLTDSSLAIDDLNNMGKSTTETPDFGIFETALTDHLSMVCVVRGIGPDFTLAQVASHPLFFCKSFVAKLADISETVHPFQGIGRKFTFLAALGIAETGNTDLFPMIFIKRCSALNTVSAQVTQIL